MTTNCYEHLLIDLNHEEHPFDENNNNNLSLKLSHASTTSSCSSFSPTYSLNLSHDQGVVACSFVESKPLLQHQKFVHDLIPCGTSWKSKREFTGFKLTIPKNEGKTGENHDRDHKDHNEEHQNGSTTPSIDCKWTSSKMRMLKSKVIKSEDQSFVREALNNNIDHVGSSTDVSMGNSPNHLNSPTMRFCVDCNTTRTPLWRSGPQGPKSLCNACGIRRRKARKAAMAAAIAHEASTSNNNTSKFMSNTHTDIGTQQMKKRSKTNNSKKVIMAQHNQMSPNNNRKLCFQEFALSLSNKLSLHQILNPDEDKEKEAAILLMAMSCGLVEG